MEQKGPGLPKEQKLAADALERTGETMAAAPSEPLLTTPEASARPAQATMEALENKHSAVDSPETEQLVILSRVESVIMKGPREDLKSYLEAVNLLKGVGHFFASNKNCMSFKGILDQVTNLLTKSSLKIESEFRSLMHTNCKSDEPEGLFDCLPNSLLASKGDSEAVVERSYTSFDPTSIPPRILSLLQLVQDGNHHSCYEIYRLFGDRRPMNIESK